MNESTLTTWTPVNSSCRNLKRWKAAHIMSKPQTLEWDCSGPGVIGSFCFSRKLYFLRPRESAKDNIWREFAIIVQYSICILLGCLSLMAKVSLSKVGTESQGKEPRYRYLSSGIGLSFCWRETLSILDVFSNKNKIVNCNRRHSSSQYNEFSNVFQRKSKV